MTRAVILSPMGPPAELIPPLKISFFSLFALFWPCENLRGGAGAKMVLWAAPRCWRRRLQPQDGRGGE